MKLHVMFVAFIFYTFIVQAEPINELRQSATQSQRPAISITINSKPHSGCQLDSETNQEAKHKSQPTTHVDSAIQQKTNQTARGHGMTVADALNAYITLVCWPIGGLIYWMRTSSEE